MCAEKIGEEKREIVVYLPNCKVEGWIYLARVAHLSDFITLTPKKFVTVVDATVSAIRAHEIWKYRVEKISINKEYIVNIFSRAAMKPAEERKANES